MFEMTAVWK